MNENIPLTVKDRRPIASRNAAWARSAARFLSKTGVTPNAISVASMFFAALAGVSLALAFRYPGWPGSALLLASAACIQLRLVCNLLDGMVAIEGGRKTATGALFNDLPDRISDTFILAGIGYGLTDFSWSVSLGWATALLAALTAYIRVLGGACGLDQRFTGPMAKPHRMALITLSALIVMFLPAQNGQFLMMIALSIIALGSLLTCIVRGVNLYADLAQQDTRED